MTCMSTERAAITKTKTKTKTKTNTKTKTKTKTTTDYSDYNDYSLTTD